jgi:O-succinylbenzoate synthase
LLGGFIRCNQWIECAEKLEIGWWVTSALESNIGLNAICQYTDNLSVKIPQGLGTGELFTNNIPSPLEIKKSEIRLNKYKNWDVSEILKE